MWLWETRGMHSMPAFIDLFLGFGLWNWFIAGLVLMALEAVIPGVQFLWFGLSAMVVGLILTLLTWAGVGEAMTLPWQLVLFATVSVATVFAVRFFSDHQAVDRADLTLNQRAAQYIGRIVVVEEEIRGGRGRVRVGDTLWAAAGDDIPQGARVRITGAEGTVLVVEPA